MNADGAQAPSKKQLEFERRERLILSAALSLFEGPHWEQVTVEQISKQAEIGKGTVYKHFTCKEEIYAHIALDFSEQLMNAYEQLDPELDVLATLKQVIGLSFSSFLANTEQARVMLYCKRSDYRERLSPALRERFEQADERFEHYINGVLELGVERKLLPKLPNEQLLMGLEATFDGALAMIWNGHNGYQQADDQESYVRIISEYMLAGLLGLKK